MKAAVHSSKLYAVGIRNAQCVQKRILESGQGILLKMNSLALSLVFSFLAILTIFSEYQKQYVVHELQCLYVLLEIKSQANKVVFQFAKQEIHMQIVLCSQSSSSNQQNYKTVSKKNMLEQKLQQSFSRSLKTNTAPCLSCHLCLW